MAEQIKGSAILPPHYTTGQALLVLGLSTRSVSAVRQYIDAGKLKDIRGLREKSPGSSLKLSVESVLSLRDELQQKRIDVETRKRHEAERRQERLSRQPRLAPLPSGQQATRSDRVLEALGDQTALLRRIASALEALTQSQSGQAEKIKAAVSEAVKESIG